MAQSATARAIFTPPGVPADRVEVLRRAFDQTVKDKAFMAEVAKLQTIIEPDTGEEVQSEVKRLLSTSPRSRRRSWTCSSNMPGTVGTANWLLRGGARRTAA